MKTDVLEKAIAMVEQGRAVALVTVVESSGSVPAEVGGRMIVWDDGQEGTVGGGSLEHEAVKLGRQMLSGADRGRLVSIDVEKLGMKCGGEVKLFLEVLQPAKALWIFGGGHIGQSLAPMAQSLGWSVTVADDRPEFAVKDRFPKARQVLCLEYRESALRIPPGAYVVIVTHGHKHDYDVLVEACRHDPPLPYIGMIGSASKVGHTTAQLKADGVTEMSNVYSPIGLDIGGGSPAEIAVAIAAEIQGVMHGKKDLPHCRKRITR